jgi:multidrug efflux system outer membrane protein
MLTTKRPDDLEREKSLAAAQDEARKAVEDARTLQSTGRVSALATLDAERTLESALASLAAVQTQIAQNQIAVFLALGGGWQTGAPGQS